MSTREKRLIAELESAKFHLYQAAGALEEIKSFVKAGKAKALAREVTMAIQITGLGSGANCLLHPESSMDIRHNWGESGYCLDCDKKHPDKVDR